MNTPATHNAEDVLDHSPGVAETIVVAPFSCCQFILGKWSHEVWLYRESFITNQHVWGALIRVGQRGI